MSKIDSELVEILVCPLTRKRVSLASIDMVERLNHAISEGRIRNEEGQIVREPLQDGLLREDGRILYPIRDTIPVMLIGEGISTDQLIN